MMLKPDSLACRLCLAVTIAWALPVLSFSEQAASTSARVALYASVGEELIVYSVDVEHATLAMRSSVTLPGFVQEAWAASSSPFLYVAWSNGGASYIGSGITPAGDKHGVTAFRIDSASGELRVHGSPAALRSRPMPSNGSAILVTRGNEPTPATDDAAGA